MLDDRLLSEICRFFLSYQETLQHILHLKCRGLESFICGLEGAARSSAVTLNSSAQEATAGFEASHVKDQTPAACSLSGGPVEISQRGKSTLETLQFTTGIHLHFTEQFSFFSKRMRPQLPLCWVSTPSVVLCFVFFFSKRCVTGLWFFSPVTAHRKCVVSKQVPVTVSTPHRGPQS